MAAKPNTLQQLLKASPTALRGGLSHTIVLTNSSDLSLAWKVKAERRGANHVIEPSSGIIGPQSTEKVKVEVDNSVEMDDEQKDRLVVMYMPTELEACDDIPQLIGILHDKLATALEDEEQLVVDRAAIPCSTLTSFSPQDVVQFLIAPHKGLLLFSTFFGSNAYNLQTSSTADIDVYGIFVAPLKDFVKIRSHLISQPYVEQLAGQQRMKVQDREELIDYTIREVGNFCTLLLSGSPNTIEMLYMWPPPASASQDVSFQAANTYANADVWKELISLRDQFLTKRFAKLYLGWAINACERKKKNQIQRKGICHAMRIQSEIERILKKRKGPRLAMKPGRLRDEILSIKRGERDAYLPELANNLRVQLRELDHRISLSDLPEQVSEATQEALNNWYGKQTSTTEICRIFATRLRNMEGVGV